MKISDKGGIGMSNSEVMKELYCRCKEMNMDEMIEIILNAETKEEFVSYLS